MKNIIHYALVLFIIAGVAGLGLHGVSAATENRIAESKKAALANGQKIAFPGATKFSNEKTFDVHDKKAVYYDAMDSSGKTIGYVLRYGVMGYQSIVEVLTGITPDGTVKAIKVLSQAETPGLGAEVDTLPSSGTIWNKVGSLVSNKKEEKKEGPPPIPAFQAQYSNKPISGLKVVKEKTDEYIESIVEVLTGITPDGTVKAIKVLSQAETPGLGAEVDTLPSSGTIWSKVGSLVSNKKEEKKDGPPPIPAFQAQYSDKPISGLKVVKEKTDEYIESISGATITSRAVTRAVREPAEAFVKEILKK